MPGRDGTPLGRHVTRHDLRQQLATDDHMQKLGFQLPRARKPATAELAKEGSLFLPGQRRTKKRRSPIKQSRAQTPDARRLSQAGMSTVQLPSDYTLDYMASEISFNGSRSELLPPSAPFSFMRPSGPLERERARPHSAPSLDPTDGIYNLPRWPAYQLGGLEVSGTYETPEHSEHRQACWSPDRTDALAEPLRGPKGGYECLAKKIEARLLEDLQAQSIHKDKKPISEERLQTFAKPLPHKQGTKYVKPVEVINWKPRKRKNRQQQQQQQKEDVANAVVASTNTAAEQRVLEVKTVDGMELTQVVTKAIQPTSEDVNEPPSGGMNLSSTAYPDRDMTGVSAELPPLTRCDPAVTTTDMPNRLAIG